ncbi:MAG: PKD domain-containing protein, partial [Gammaproteobacteria bacterium]|nr:PKD domain-containing protein [Gammaproteobacteria bacterium]
GTTVTLTNANTATPTFTAPSTAGALSFQLTTTDNSTYTASDSVIVIVNPAPTANAGVDQVVSTNNTVSLTGAASTAVVGSIVSYAWNQTSGTAVTLTNGATKTPTFTAPSTAGTLVFDLTVTDTNGATATDSVIITVAGSLTVDVGLDQTVNPGATVNLNGAASGSAGNINSYAWTQTSGTTVTLNNATTTAANFTAPLAAGVLTFQMTASDDLLASGSDILNVTVNNIAPVLATISNVSINVGASVNFTISATDANGVAPTLEVSGLQTGIAFNAATGEFNWSNVPTAGTYTFTARAIDAQDSAIVDEQIFTITVASSGTLGFSVSTLTLNESDSATTITVNRTSGSAGIVTVNYAASNGTASSGSDFTAVSGTLTFADGVTSQTFTVSPIDDSIYEESETFTLNLSGATGYASITGGSIAVTINDNDTAVVGSLTLSASTYSVSENAGIKVITVNRVGGSDTAISVDYATSNGTALAGSDYTATSGTLSFAHGDTSKTFSITILDNSVYEGNEDLNITLSNPTTGVIINTSTAVLSIIENDAAIVGSLGLDASSYSIAENGGSKTITVNRTGGSDTAISIDYATSNGIATAGSDYTAASGTLNFAHGVTSQTFTIAILNDSNYEGDETLTITLSNATSGVAVNTSSASLSITEDDVAVVGSLTLSASTYAVAEDGGSKIITVNRVGGSDTAISVNYTTSDGTALAGSDYTAASGTLNFAQGDTSKTFSITILDNSVYEGNEDLNITLSNPTTGVTITTSTAVLSITENDAAIVGSLGLDASSYSIAENGGSKTITVNRTGGSDTAISIDYATSNGTATAGSDYTSATGTLNFADGVTSQTFTITILNDSNYEGDETLTITLSNATSGVTVNTSNAGLTITEDDVAVVGSLTLSASTYAVAEDGMSKIITVNRVGGSDTAISVNYTTSDGTATAGSDYSATTGTLNFADGVISQTFSLPILDDTSYEGDEALTLTLSNPTSGVLISTSSASLTITENDAPVPGSLTLSATNYSVAENGVSQTITVNRVGGSNGAVTVDYATSNGTATAGSDYTSASGTLNFADGVTSQTFLIAIIDDVNYEGNEALTITLSNPTSGTTLGTSSASLTVTEDDAAIVGSLSFSATSYSVAENVVSQIITVNRVGGSDTAISVAYSTSNATATAGNDYTAASGALNFADGVTSQTFTVLILDDTNYEGDENINVSLVNPTNGATLNVSNTSIVILDNDLAPQPGSLTLSQPTYTVAENGTNVSIAVNRVGGSDGTVSVDYQIADGSAAINADYLAKNGSLVFTDGVMTQSFVITILDDTSQEGDETVMISLTNISANSSLDTASATLTITDDETAPITGNQPPGAPVLLSPSNGATGLNPALAIFDWREVTDPDGDAVTYVMERCLNANFSNCNVAPAAGKLESSTVVGLGGGAGVGLALLGLMGSSSRRQRFIQIAAMIALSLIMSACGTNIPIANGDGTVSQTETGLKNGTTYYWRVTATDSKGLSSTSEEWSFTTR